MIGTFTDIDGNNISISINGYRTGETLLMGTKNPAILSIKQIGGSIEYFPTALTKVLEINAISLDKDFFKDLQTQQYSVTARRNGSPFFTGKTKIFNIEEPFTAAPFIVKIMAFDQISEWKERSYYEERSVNDEVHISEIINSEILNDNLLLDEYKIRKRMLFSYSFLDLAEQITNITLSTYFVSNDLHLWVHDYETYSTSRALTGKSVEEPTISYAPPAKNVIVNTNPYSLPSMLLTESIVYPISTSPYLIASEFYANFLGGTFKTKIKLENFEVSLNKNSTYLSDEAADEVNYIILPPNFKVTCLIYVLVDGDYYFYNSNTGLWENNGSIIPSISTVESASEGFNPFIKGAIQVEKEFPGFGTSTTNSNHKCHVVWKIESLSEVFSYKAFTSASFKVGGTIDIIFGNYKFDLYFENAYNTGNAILKNFNKKEETTESINSFGVDYSVDVSISDYLWVGSTQNSNLILIRPFGRFYEDISTIYNSRLYKKRTEISKGEGPIADYNKSLIEELLTRLTLYLSDKIELLDITIIADEDLYINPLKPFLFNNEKGDGEFLYKVLEGKINVAENLFEGTIHKINV